MNDGVGFFIRHHTFKMVDVTSFHAEKCCHLASEHEAPAWHSSIAHQFLISSTFVLFSGSIFSRHFAHKI